MKRRSRPTSAGVDQPQSMCLIEYWDTFSIISNFCDKRHYLQFLRHDNRNSFVCILSSPARHVLHFNRSKQKKREKRKKTRKTRKTRKKENELSVRRTSSRTYVDSRTEYSSNILPILSHSPPHSIHNTSKKQSNNKLLIPFSSLFIP